MRLSLAEHIRKEFIKLSKKGQKRFFGGAKSREERKSQSQAEQSPEQREAVHFLNAKTGAIGSDTLQYLIKQSINMKYFSGFFNDFQRQVLGNNLLPRYLEYAKIIEILNQHPEWIKSGIFDLEDLIFTLLVVDMSKHQQQVKTLLGHFKRFGESSNPYDKILQAFKNIGRFYPSNPEVSKSIDQLQSALNETSYLPDLLRLDYLDVINILLLSHNFPMTFDALDFTALTQRIENLMNQEADGNQLRLLASTCRAFLKPAQYLLVVNALPEKSQQYFRGGKVGQAEEKHDGKLLRHFFVMLRELYAKIPLVNNSPQGLAPSISTADFIALVQAINIDNPITENDCWWEPVHQMMDDALKKHHFKVFATLYKLVENFSSDADKKHFLRKLQTTQLHWLDAVLRNNKNRLGDFDWLQSILDQLVQINEVNDGEDIRHQFVLHIFRVIYKKQIGKLPLRENGVVVLPKGFKFSLADGPNPFFEREAITLVRFLPKKDLLNFLSRYFTELSAGQVVNFIEFAGEVLCDYPLELNRLVEFLVELMDCKNYLSSDRIKAIQQKIVEHDSLEVRDLWARVLVEAILRKNDYSDFPGYIEELNLENPMQYHRIFFRAKFFADQSEIFKHCDNYDAGIFIRILNGLSVGEIEQAKIISQFKHILWEAIETSDSKAKQILENFITSKKINNESVAMLLEHFEQVARQRGRLIRVFSGQAQSSQELESLLNNIINNGFSFKKTRLANRALLSHENTKLLTSDIDAIKFTNAGFTKILGKFILRRTKQNHIQWNKNLIESISSILADTRYEIRYKWINYLADQLFQFEAFDILEHYQFFEKQVDLLDVGDKAKKQLLAAALNGHQEKVLGCVGAMMQVMGKDKKSQAEWTKGGYARNLAFLLANLSTVSNLQGKELSGEAQLELFKDNAQREGLKSQFLRTEVLLKFISTLLQQYQNKQIEKADRKILIETVQRINLFKQGGGASRFAGSANLLCFLLLMDAKQSRQARLPDSLQAIWQQAKELGLLSEEIESKAHASLLGFDR